MYMYICIRIHEHINILMFEYDYGLARDERHKRRSCCSVMLFSVILHYVLSQYIICCHILVYYFTLCNVLLYPPTGGIPARFS